MEDPIPGDETRTKKQDDHRFARGAIFGAFLTGLLWVVTAEWSKQKVRGSTCGPYDELQPDKVCPAQRGELECIVCFENRVDCALRPCNHIVLCQRCAVQLRKCPVCKKAIGARIGPMYQ